MPSSSKKQHNFMAAIANNPAFAKKAGIPQSVGQDFTTADKGRKFSKGGDMATKMNPGFMAMMAKKKDGMAAFEKSGKDVEKKGMKEGSKADMALDKKQMGMKKGGMANGGAFRASANGIAQQGKTKATQIKMNKGGMSC